MPKDEGEGSVMFDNSPPTTSAPAPRFWLPAYVNCCELLRKGKASVGLLPIIFQRLQALKQRVA